MKPLVSVIIPYYNRPEKLQRALTSVMQQTHKNIEVLVVDDASTIPPQGLEAFPKVQLLKNKKNSGPGVSRNTGMQKANGSYLAFLDCDDYWAPQFLESCLQQFENTKEPLLFVYANSYTVKEDVNTGLRHLQIVDTQQVIPDIFKNRRPWCTSACLWHQSLLGTQRWLPTRSWEDYAFDTEAAVRCNKVGVVKEPLVYYEEGGADKLSDQAKDKTETQKAPSIIHISKTLRNSTFIEQPFLRHKLKALLLARIIFKLRNGEENMGESELFQEYVIHSKKWKNSFIRILLKTNPIGAIKFLEKQKINASKKADQYLA
ncbi:glycosyltransferase family 2 protein [Ascidiimonas sp. W6]|uniref:glycosyltransferase family 2 protein n=1 Tax=Ascidiimonas meishanensis TaxID=3128903 RepID=UPI0030EC9665